MQCGICGRGFVFGGNGQKDHLICKGAREYACWNGFTVDGPLAAQRILDAVLAAGEGLPDFEPAFSNWSMTKHASLMANGSLSCGKCCRRFPRPTARLPI